MRRLHAIQKCYSTAVLLRHFFGCGRNTRGLKNAIFERLFLLFFLLNCGTLLHAQNGVNISSDKEPGPTSANPIPIDIKFEGPVNRNLVEADFEVTNGGISNFQRGIPEFENFSSTNIDAFPVVANIPDFFDSGYSNPISEQQRMAYLVNKIGTSVISIDIDSAGNIYYLTFAEGVFLYLEDDEDKNIIPGDEFEVPLDMVIDNKDRIIVADPDNLRVRIFNSDGSFVYDIGGSFGNGSGDFYGPSGLAVNDANILYVADQYSGQYEGENVDLVKLYNLNASQEDFIRQFGFNILDDPFRIAVDGSNNVFVSDSGDSGRVLVFNDEDELKFTILSGSGDSPGSLITDEFGYLYVINYNGDLTFSDIYVDPLVLISNYTQIQNGNYQVDVYSPFPNLNLLTTFSQNLNLPIDLALDECNKIVVNDLELGGQAQSILNIQAHFDFDLEKFRRQDNFTAEVVPVAPGEVKVVIEESDLFKCDPQPEGGFSIIYETNTSVNTPPVAVDDDFYTTPENTTLTIGAPGVLGNDNDPDNDSLTATVISNSSVGTLTLNLDGSFAYVPETDYTGPVTFTYVASDGEDTSNTATVTINVTAVNDPPVAVDDSYSTPENTTLTIGVPGVLENDNDPDNDPLTAIVVSNPSVGTLTLNPDGSFTYVPETDYTGPVTFIYVASDGEDTSNTTTVTINVTAVNDPPVAQDDDFYTTPENTTLTIGAPGVLGNDNDPDNDSLTATVVSNPSVGTLTLNLDGSFTYVPETDYTGPVTFTYAASDGEDTSNTATVTINVQSDPDTTDPIFTNCPPNNLTFPTSSEICGTNVEYDVPIATDDSGTVNVVLVEGPAPGDFVGAGKTVLVKYTATGPTGNTSECSFEITVSKDETPPTITCPPDVNETVPLGETGMVITYDLPIFGDNCPESNILQTDGLSSGSEFPVGETTTNIFEVTDAAGNTRTCSFTVTITASNDEVDPVINCPTDIEVLADPGTCGAEVEYDWPTATDNAGEPTISIINGGPVSGSIFPVGPTKIEFEARDAAGNIDTCTLTITVKDEEAPVFTTCPQSTQRTITAVNGKFLVPNLLGEVKAEDNCTSDAAITYTQEPEAGEEIFSNTTLKIYASDEYSNQSVACEIQLIVNDNEDPLEISCPANSTPSFGEGCAFKLPDYKNLATVNSSTAQITQDPPEGTLIYGSTKITLTATEGNQIADCSFTVDPVDDVKPIINCRDDLEIHLNEDGFGVIPPEILLSSIEDNCGIDNVSLSKSRFKTSDVGENDILVTVEDVNGNIETCEATVNVVPYDPLKDIRCTESGELELDQDGYAELTLTYTGEEEDIQLELSKKDFTCDDIGLPQMITATYNGQYTGSCEVEVTVVDKLAPRVNCISKIDLVLDANGQGQLSVEDVDLNSTDNCKIEDMTLSKSNFTTEDVGNQTVRFTVTDASGNSDFCEVVVNVRPFMGTGGDLNCVEEIVLQLNNDGNAILKAEDLFDGDPSGIDFYGETTYTCEDLGTNYITFSKVDDPSQTCEIRVEVEDNIDPVAHCKADYVLTLGANGTATLSPEDFGAGSTDNCGIASMSLNRTSFTTADLGQQQLLLTVTDNSGNVGTCETPILVQPYEENPSGIECKALFVLALNANGSAQLQPQDLFTGGMSGTYNVSQSIFTCEDLGENEVILSYSTMNGSGTCTVKVMVEDPQIFCDTSPAPERDSLIMYPNPGDGLISFELSPGLQINRIEIFDFRGRFLREQQYDNSQPIPDYQLDLSAYQAGVYPLVIYTNWREYLKRAIIK
jgi:hypothetical protein